MTTIHLVIEKGEGEDNGRQITVPPDGARMGRSSKNDIVLLDPLLSRHHCRLFFKPNDGLHITDLGSSNETLVNGKTITETKLHIGDRISVGDTIIRVQNNGMEPIPGNAMIGGASVVDLGLSPESVRAKSRKKLGKGPLVIIGLLVMAVALAALLPKFINKKEKKTDDVPVKQENKLKQLIVDYEKVEADPQNIFRYKLDISEKNVVSIEIDDVQNNRTSRKEKTVNDDMIQDLVRYIEKSGFMEIESKYAGVQPDILNQWDLSITIDKNNHRCVVINRPEPEIFKDIREKIEIFGKNELGLWAIQFSTEKLLEMAHEEYLLGRKLYDEREVKYGNLANAIISFRKAEIDLETVEPKPDYYSDCIATREEATKQLQERYNDLNFQAERSIRLQEWAKAAENLKIIQEMIPDRADERHSLARKQLLNVEEHMNIR